MKHGIVCEKGINDMPRGWTRKNELNFKIYQTWHSMLTRVYDKRILDKSSTYLETTLQLEFHWLSYFAEHVKEIDGYDEEKFLNGKIELDKDIKSNGTDKEYSIKNCKFVNKSDNIKQANKTRNYSSISGENSKWYGKSKTDEEKALISKIHKGKEISKEHRESISIKNKGKGHPKAKKVAQYDKQGNLIRIWDYAKQVSEELGINYGTLKSWLQHKNKQTSEFIFEYYTEGVNNDERL